MARAVLTPRWANVCDVGPTRCQHSVMCGAGRLVTGTKSLISGNCFPPFYACWSSAEICTQQPARTPAQLAFHPPVSDGPGHAGTRPAPAWCKEISPWAPRTRVTARLIASYTPRIFWQYRTFSGKSDQSPPTPRCGEVGALQGGGPRVVVSTAAFHARVRGSVPGLGGLKETKVFLPHPRVKVSIVGSLRDREVACSASDRQGSNLESCVWRTVSSQSSRHPQEVLLAQFSLYVHKGGLKPDSFHFALHW